MSALAEVFAPLVVLILIGLGIAVYRLNRRVSRGSYDAGPRQPETQNPPGLRPSPWELSVIDDQLRVRNRVSHDLITTINRLVTAADLPPSHRLSPGASVMEMQQTVTLLEQHLELGPLDPNDLN